MGLKLANFQEKIFRKMDYTVQQKVWTVIWYGMHGQPKKVQIEYRKKFGRHAKTPTRHAIHNCWQKIFETGSVNKIPLKIDDFVVEFLLLSFNKFYLSLISIDCPNDGL